METTLARPDTLPFCPICLRSDATALPVARDYSNPLAKTVYVYKCKCGAAFTSSYPPQNPSYPDFSESPSPSSP